MVALHGSAHAGASVVADDLRDAVAARLPDIEVATAWVDARVRTLSPELTAGAVVVPAFLTAGYHVDVDVPASGGLVTPHVGPRLLGALAERLVEAGGPGDAILLAAAGSKRPEALDEVERAAAALWRRFGVPVRVGYLYGGGASVEERAVELAAEGFGEVSVASFFLAPGLYSARLDALPVARVAAPIGVHPALVDAVVSLFRGAVRRRGVADASAPDAFVEQPGLVALPTLAAPVGDTYLAGLNLAGRRVLVAGAGKVASRRIPALLAAGGDLLVVAPEASALVTELAEAGRLTWAARPVQAGDLEGAWFVQAATSDARANALIADAAEASRIFCVRADQVDAGTARTAATGTADGLTVGVASTTGRAPRLVAEARDVAVAALDAWARASARGAA